MRVRAIETFITWGDPRNWVFVKVATDTELYGWGEATLEGRESTVVACIKELGEALVGRDPLTVEHHWQALYRHGFWRGGVVLNTALAALDQALWDLRGKAWGVPVYLLLGGPTRERVELYTHVGIYDPALLRADALAAVSAGFRALKTGAWVKDATLSETAIISAMAERVHELRDVIGAGIDIMVDNHGRSRPSAALQLARALEPYNLRWIEEPIQPDDVEGLRALRSAGLAIDIAAGERMYSKWEFATLLESRVVDIIQPDLCHAGGITECKKIAALAEAHYVQVAPHNPQGPISTAASAHLALAIPNFAILEYVPSAPYRERVMGEPWVVSDGYLQVPNSPGLGVDLDEQALMDTPPRRVRTPSEAWASDGSVADV